MSRLDLYKLYTSFMFDCVSMFLMYSIWVYSLDKPLLDILASVYFTIVVIRFFINMIVIQKMEESGEFKKELDIAAKIINILLLSIVIFTVLLYCVIKALIMVV